MLAPDKTRWSTPPPFFESLNRQTLAMPSAQSTSLAPCPQPSCLALGARTTWSSAAGEALGKRPRWLRPLVRRIVAEFGRKSHRRIRTLAKFIINDPAFQRTWERASREGVEVFAAKRRMPVMSPCWPAGDVERACTLHARRVGRLAGTARLANSIGSRIARRERNLPVGPLRHYTYRWVPKRSGGVRLIESPKARLKRSSGACCMAFWMRFRRTIAHGFRRGHGVRSFIASHVCKRVVLRMDSQDFFMSIEPGSPPFFLRPVIPSLWRCSWRDYAQIASRGTSGSTGRSCPARFSPPKALRWPHLPQGSPTSPVLASLCAYRLDCRLQGPGPQCQAQYTRYADDLVFSGGQDFQRPVRGFGIHSRPLRSRKASASRPRKTRIMRQSVRQHVAGVVINVRPNVRRADYDQLKAVLHNCVRHGPAAQNRDGLEQFAAHLAGRVAHVAMLNRTRGAQTPSVVRSHRLVKVARWIKFSVHCGYAAAVNCPDRRSHAAKRGRPPGNAGATRAKHSDNLQRPPS